MSLFKAAAIESPAYYIQFRFFGKAKLLIRKLLRERNKIFDVKPVRDIPHITLAGPFSTKDENRLVQTLFSLCRSKPIMYFFVDGFDVFEDKKVVFLKINPCKMLDDFRWELSKKLRLFCKLSSYDIERKFAFHTTVMKNIPEEKFELMKQYYTQESSIGFKQFMIRATLVKNGLILCEYDFLLKELLDRKKALDNKLLVHSISILKNTK